MSTFLSSLLPAGDVKRASPDKCTVYWDYENMPIPKAANLSEILSTLKGKLWTLIGSKLPIEWKVYIRASKLTRQIQSDFDICGVVQIQVPSAKPESVDKRLLIDMMFSLYELERDKKSRAIALISGDRDFGHLLGKIHHQPPVSNSFLILLRKCHIDKNLSNVVDEVIQLDYAATEPVKSDLLSEQKQEPQIKEVKEPKKKKINISIRQFNDVNNGKAFKLKTTTTNHVDNIKREILSRHNLKQTVNTHQIALICNGKELKQGTLGQYGFNDGTKLIWRLNDDKVVNSNKNSKKKAKKKISLKLQNLSSDETFVVNAKKSNKIYFLKQEIYTKYKSSKEIKMKFDEIVIYNEGKELMDLHLISDCGLKEGDLLIWYADPKRIANKKKSLPMPPKTSKKEKKKKKKIKIIFVHRDEKYPQFEIESTLLNQIHNLQTRIAQKFNVQAKQIEFSFKSKTLCAKDTLKQCGICENCIILWQSVMKSELNDENKNKNNDDDNMAIESTFSWNFPKNDPTEEQKEITVVVKNATNGATLMFTMNGNNLILDLKRKIAERLHINSFDQKLTFKGNLLNDFDKAHVLQAYGYVDGDTIDLDVRIGSITFDVEVFGSEIIKNFMFKSNVSVLDLKKKLSERCGLLPNQQWITFNNKMLNDHCTLYHYGITNGSLLKMSMVKEI